MAATAGLHYAGSSQLAEVLTTSLPEAETKRQKNLGQMRQSTHRTIAPCVCPPKTAGQHVCHMAPINEHSGHGWPPSRTKGCATHTLHFNCRQQSAMLTVPPRGKPEQPQTRHTRWQWQLRAIPLNMNTSLSTRY